MDYLEFRSLYHHGIKGQEWGERNGPPYPLDSDDYSEEERRADEENYNRQKRKKRALVAVAAIAAVGLGALAIKRNAARKKNEEVAAKELALKLEKERQIKKQERQIKSQERRIKSKEKASIKKIESYNSAFEKAKKQAYKTGSTKGIKMKTFYEQNAKKIEDYAKAGKMNIAKIQKKEKATKELLDKGRRSVENSPIFWELLMPRA